MANSPDVSGRRLGTWRRILVAPSCLWYNSTYEGMVRASWHRLGPSFDKLRTNGYVSKPPT